MPTSITRTILLGKTANLVHRIRAHKKASVKQALNIDELSATAIRLAKENPRVAKALALTAAGGGVGLLGGALSGHAALGTGLGLGAGAAGGIASSYGDKIVGKIKNMLPKKKPQPKDGIVEPPETMGERLMYEAKLPSIPEATALGLGGAGSLAAMRVAKPAIQRVSSSPLIRAILTGGSALAGGLGGGTAGYAAGTVVPKVVSKGYNAAADALSSGTGTVSSIVGDALSRL